MVLIEEALNISTLYKLRLIGPIADFYALPVLFGLISALGGAPLRKITLKKHLILPSLVTIIVLIDIFLGEMTLKLSQTSLIIYGLKPFVYAYYAVLFFQQMNKLFQFSRNSQKNAIWQWAWFLSGVSRCRGLRGEQAHR